MQRAKFIFAELLGCYTAGLIIAYIYPFASLKLSITVAGTMVFSLLLLLNLKYGSWGLYRFKPFILFLFYLLMMVAGYWRWMEQRQDLQPAHFSKAPTEKLLVRIADEPQVKKKTIRFKATVVHGFQSGKVFPCTGTLLIYLKTGHFFPSYGDEFIIPSNFKTINASSNSNGFDFKAWLAMQNIYHRCYLKEHMFLLVRRNQGNPLISFALRLRKQQIDLYRKILKGDEAFSVASTLILGYRADLSNETLSAYTKTGTIHALSVSGMHVGIIYIVLHQLLFFCNRLLFLRICRSFLIIFLIWFYALLTGFSPSVLRSVIMLTIYIFSKDTGRQTNNYNILAFSAFCILLYDPFLLFDVGFQLSYLSVFGLIDIQPALLKWFTFKQRWCSKLWGILALSLSAQLTTFPLSIYYFHQFPVYFLFSNLFIMIPAALMMYLGLSILIFKLYFLAPYFEWLIGFTNGGLKWIAGFQGSTVSGIWIDKAELLLLSSALFFLVQALKHYHKRMLYVSLLLFLILEMQIAKDKLTSKPYIMLRSGQK